MRETRFGVTLADPYRWMEAEGTELRDWLAEQGRHAAAVLASLPAHAELLARIRHCAEPAGPAGGDSAFKLAGDRVFHLRQRPGDTVPVLMAVDTAGPRILLDPATLPDPATPTTSATPERGHAEHGHLDWFVPSPDGRLVACGVSAGGSEDSALRIVDADRGELLPDVVPGTFLGGVSWVPGRDALVCHRYLPPAAGTPPDRRRRDSRACLHRVGTPAADDVVVLARGRNPRVPLEPVDRPFVLTPVGSDWMIAVISHSALAGPVGEDMSDCSLYVAPRAALDDPATCPWQWVAGPADGVTSFAMHGDVLYLVAHGGRPRALVLAVPLAAPGLTAPDLTAPYLAAVPVVVRESDRDVVAVRVAGDQLLVHDQEAGLSRMRRVPLTGGAPQEVPLPVDGALQEWAGHPRRPEALLTLNSWTCSPRLYRYDSAADTVTDTGWLPPSAADFSGITMSDLSVPARDGTLIPLRVVHQKGRLRDGASPMILSGYGSYGYVPRHLFEPEMLAWYERGGSYAAAGLRGGGEYGRAWHEAGCGAGKENTITDFIDCAEFLIAQGYTSPERLAGEGTSAGGIPVGGALVRRPELFAAMVLQVAATNLTRNEFGENGPINVPEFGSVTTEDGLRDLLIADCYLRVRDGTAYPAVLLTVGLNDMRLPAWEPAKMAARLQAATTSGRPVLLRVDAHAGHGHGSTQAQRWSLTADILAFLVHELDPRH